MMNLIVLVLLAKSFTQSIYNLYLLQFNEYRFDRFSGYVRRRYGMWIIALPFLTLGAQFSSKKLPKPTGKALILVGLNVVLHYLLYIAPHSIRLELTLLVLFATPFVQVLLTYVTWPIEFVMRKHYYAAARTHIAQHKNQGLTVIGITGSYGKSTTKYFLEHILSSHYPVVSTKGSINSPLALSKIFLKSLTSKHKFLIAEMGAYKRGEIRELAHIAQPDIAILTGISNQHIELFGSQNNIIEGKSELLESLEKKSLAIINSDSPQKPIIPKNKNLKIVPYGKTKLPQDIQKALHESALPPFLYQNVEPALVLAQKYKIPHEKVLKSIKTLPLPPKTMTLKKGRKDTLLIDDSYSSNIKGALAAIDTLLEQEHTKKIVVMSCLIELGKDAAKAHKQIGSMLSKNNILTVVTTTECYKDISGQFSNDQANMCILQTGPEKTQKWLNDHLGEKTAILVEGKVNPSIVKYIES